MLQVMTKKHFGPCVYNEVEMSWQNADSVSADTTLFLLQAWQAALLHTQQVSLLQTQHLRLLQTSIFNPST